jgi:hypothetical protein
MALRDLFRGDGSQLAPDVHLEKSFRWLCRAQDKTEDGGVSEGYHLYHGWLPSYPETTGYIIDTFFDYHHALRGDRTRIRALRMADWLVTIQNRDGSIPDSYFQQKLVFDTGQVLFGFVRAYEETGEERYKAAAASAAEWLVSVQSEDGSWIRCALNDLPHTYYSRVAWSLVRAHAALKLEDALDAAVRNIEWVIRQQQENGWFKHAGFTIKGHLAPFTHTIAYTIRGVLEVGLYLEEEKYLLSARKSVDGLLDSFPRSGRVPGTYDAQWGGNDRLTCLTGNAQLAIVLLRLFGHDPSERYLEAARTMIRYVKSKQELRVANPDIHGALAGSHPIWGEYIHFCYPNWAAKFFMDALMLESRVLSAEAPAVPDPGPPSQSDSLGDGEGVT